MPVDPLSILGIAIGIASIAAPFIVPAPVRTEFITVPSFRYTHGRDIGPGGFLGTVTGKIENGGQIYGQTGDRQWIQHDEIQSNSYDQPAPYFGWLNGFGAWPPGGNAKWIDYWASRSQDTWFCMVRFDYRLDPVRANFGFNGGTFPAGLLAKSQGLPWYHAGYHIESPHDPNNFQWQDCAWITHSAEYGPRGFWFDVPFFSDLMSRRNDWN
jgi:hypothetical protein